MKQLVERFFDMIEQHGWQGRIVPIARLTDLQRTICGLSERGLIDKILYQNQLNFISYDPPADLPGARSIIIVAVPTPQMRIFFHWRGEIVPVIIPPTYVSYTPRTEAVQQVLSAWLQREDYHLAKPQLPLKTLAVRSGLARYGRNNICYVPGRGSFIQLVGAFSDLPGEGDPWQEPEALERCDSCTACLRSCPTAAISSDRFLLRAELCLTYHNESANDFPAWIDPSWHHCLIGCLRCQTVCPENKAVLNWFEDRAEFSEQETTLFIQRTSFDQLPVEATRKIKSLEINENYQMLCRNLSMIIK
jgi:epoxyqueuosine reductase